MNREEVIKFFLEELKKVPNREVCQIATEKQIKRITEELEFDEVGKFLEKEDLNLRVAEVPKEQHFEAIFYFILMMEFTDYYAEDSEIWDLDDTDNIKFIENVKDILEDDDSISLAWVKDILENIEKLNF